MNELILHHYPLSPFAEKLRLVLGAKRLPWRSVHIPIVMPKPDLLALTGGYRRTPVLQIGADVYCDTALAARVLDRLQPQPPLYPASAPLAPLLAQWADSTLFWTVIGYVMQPAGRAGLFAGLPPEAVKAFGVDRASFSAGLPRRRPADAAVELQAALAALEAQLADGRAFLFGPALSIADFSVAHGLWFVRRAGPPVAAVLDAAPRLSAWLERMQAFGHGEPTPMGSEAAIDVARAATAHAEAGVQPGFGFEAGAPVTVAPLDYGTDPVAGTLVGLDAGEVVLRRRDERAGVVHVHFPRVGFQLKPQETSP